ncbi:MAG: SRPBCC family protein [Anaerolineae bacterium]
MISFEKTVYIKRPRQEVFDFVSDPANDALYRKGARFSEWSSEGPVGVGSTMRTVDRFIGREVETTSEITIWDPPKKYAFQTVGGPAVARFTLAFESIEDGTKLTSCGEVEFKGLLKVVGWLLGRQIKNQAQSDFDTLKRLLESD